MLDLGALLDEIAIEECKLEIDRDFIVGFLAPYFPHLETRQLEATLSFVLASEAERLRS